MQHGAGEQLDQPLRFQGQYHDAESGLHYNRHRYYNPDVGRYLTPDPIKLAGGLNQYQYTPNPTGWVDPLGLSCPPPGKLGCGAPDEANKTVVTEGAPELPKAGKKTEEITEAEAKRRVLDMEKYFKMHSVAKHGPEISDQALKQRTIDGSHPTIKGKKERINSSSQFVSYRLQYHAISHALSEMHRSPPRPTGQDRQGNPVVRMQMPGAGRGYKPNRKDEKNPKLVEPLNEVEVRFDKHNKTHPFTAFPD